MLIQPGCYPDPRNDHAFRRVFGDEKREPVLRQFLNSVLRLKDEERIQHLRIADPHQVPPIEELKESILDIRCWDQHKRNFLVEMQVWDQKNFQQRALYNAAKLFVDQLGKGEDYAELR
ncbi:MAG: Rpn family recombination-promoting nuclease/putative transposase, partial [Myxococcota bacterium]